MASIFNKTNDLYENPKRNTFDLSFQNNLTLNMGDLVPCFCKEVLPGDSFKIDPTISLRTMPLIFPVQTRIRAYLHFFYVTNRSLWTDWMDFIGKTKDGLELPYVDYQHKTGSLGDYLGLPTTVVQGTGRLSTQKWFSGNYINVHSSMSNVNTVGEECLSFNLDPQFSDKPTPIISNPIALDKSFSQSDFVSIFDEIYYAMGLSGSLNYIPTQDVPDGRNSTGYTFGAEKYNQTIRNGGMFIQKSLFNSTKKISFCYYCPDFNYNVVDNTGVPVESFTLLQQSVINSSSRFPNHFTAIFSWMENDNQYYAYITLSVSSGNGIVISRGDSLILFSKNGNVLDDPNISTSAIRFGEILDRNPNLQCVLLIQGIDNIILFESGSENPTDYGYISLTSNNSLSVTNSDNRIEIVTPTSEPIEITNVSLDDLPKISALPFRAYEAIYNSFYRDDRNNPLIVDGTPVYNKFIRNYDGGKDNVVNTELYQRNWESDFLTTAVQSPQQGVAPLVGITSYGEISFKDANTGELYTAQLNSSDGDTIESFTVTSPNMPNGNVKQLVDFATSGISISDLRGVNALQRWLEINMRRGLRYKDQIMSHFGVDVKYDELMMPEFIGGMTQDIYINQINQTTPSEGAPLGSIAGQGGAFGSSPHSINHYCQEHGYIIGIISIAPTPQYSQLLPKHFLKRETLDYFFPEFGHLGPQPITYAEVAPNESLLSNQSLNDVFGYQRAWYDYLASTDEVHGLFRTNLNNFVVQRFFDGRPELGKSFLTINPNALDTVFAVESSDTSHKFIGQIYFDCKAKRPIPEYGIPKLEV